MATYTQLYDVVTGHFIGVRRDDGASIPNNTASRDWNAFLEWNASQITPLSLADIAPPTPSQITQDARAAAADMFTATDAGRLLRAIVLSLLDGLNQGRPGNGLAVITVAQAKAAVLNKLSSGAAD